MPRPGVAQDACELPFGGLGALRSGGCGSTVDSNKLEHGCRMIYAGSPSFFDLGFEVGHVSTVQQVACGCSASAAKAMPAPLGTGIQTMGLRNEAMATMGPHFWNMRVPTFAVLIARMR